METYNWKKTIKANLFFLRLVGLWPKKDETYKFNLYTIYTALSFTLVQIMHPVTQIINLFFIYDDLEALTGTIFVLLTKILATLKSYVFIKNMQTLKQLMLTINSETFQPKNLQQRTIAENNFRFWKIMFVYFWITSGGTLTFWALYPILSGAAKQYRLPFFAWYPYDVRRSLVYELTYVYQIFCTGFLITCSLDMDTLIGFLNLYTGTQFDMLCDDLRNLRFTEQSLDNKEKLVNCINHHRKVLVFVETLNKVINWIILLQFFTGAVSVGFSLFQVTVVTPFSSEFYSFICYAVAITCQIFIYCWFGNEVIVKSDKVVYAIFESGWVGATLDNQKDMVCFMINSQQPLRVSAFGLFYLSLDTFITIMKTAWSYFALLHNVRDA